MVREQATNKDGTKATCTGSSLNGFLRDGPEGAIGEIQLHLNICDQSVARIERVNRNILYPFERVLGIVEYTHCEVR